MLDLDTDAPAETGVVGILVATPFPLFRHTMLLLRYDTEDLVRVLDEPPTCRLKHVPATGPILGELRLARRQAASWATPRAVLEALKALEAVPLPARCGLRAVTSGLALEVLVREASPGVRRLVERRLEQHGVMVQSLRLVEDRRDLARPLPLRCDLREAAFDPPSPTAALDSAAAHAPLAGLL